MNLPSHKPCKFLPKSHLWFMSDIIETLCREIFVNVWKIFQIKTHINLLLYIYDMKWGSNATFDRDNKLQEQVSLNNKGKHQMQSSVSSCDIKTNFIHIQWTIFKCKKMHFCDLEHNELILNLLIYLSFFIYYNRILQWWYWMINIVHWLQIY